MCMFLGGQVKVAGTNIYSRHIDRNRTFLAYQMRYAAKENVAMVLPVWTLPGHAIEFVDLSKHRDFFKTLARITDPTPFGLRSRGGSRSLSSEIPLERVGDYVASWVPSVDRLQDLNQALTIAPGAIETIARRYALFGFAVFKLAPALRGEEPHPMAFTYNHRSDELFFPCVHLHDGEGISKTETFDHVLYAQTEGGELPSDPTLELFKVEETLHDWIVPGYLSKVSIRGVRANRDVWLEVR